MKKLNLLTPLVILVSVIFMKPALAVTKTTAEEFFKMNNEQRLEMCKKHVDSEDVAACASIKSSVTPISSKAELAVIRCIEEEGSASGPAEITACAQKYLDASAADLKGYTDEQFHNAVRHCVKMKKSGTKDVATCARNRLDAEFN